ncbi:MAG: RNA-binding protein [Candidatus Bathyarchaeia archaeon]
MLESVSMLVDERSLINYVTACLTLFHSGAKETNIKAKGHAISKAVSIIKAFRRRFLSNVKVKSANMGGWTKFNLKISQNQ